MPIPAVVVGYFVANPGTFVAATAVGTAALGVSARWVMVRTGTDKMIAHAWASAQEEISVDISQANAAIHRSWEQSMGILARITHDVYDDRKPIIGIRLDKDPLQTGRSVHLPAPEISNSIPELRSNTPSKALLLNNIGLRQAKQLVPTIHLIKKTELRNLTGEVTGTIEVLAPRDENLPEDAERTEDILREFRPEMEGPFSPNDGDHVVVVHAPGEAEGPVLIALLGVEDGQRRLLVGLIEEGHESLLTDLLRRLDSEQQAPELVRNREGTSLVFDALVKNSMASGSSGTEASDEAQALTMLFDETAFADLTVAEQDHLKRWIIFYLAEQPRIIAAAKAGFNAIRIEFEMMINRPLAGASSRIPVVKVDLMRVAPENFQ